MRADVRGRYRVGPLSVRLTDPFAVSTTVKTRKARRTPRPCLLWNVVLQALAVNQGGAMLRLLTTVFIID